MSTITAFRIVGQKLIVTAAIVGVTVVITRYCYNKQLLQAAEEVNGYTHR